MPNRRLRNTDQPPIVGIFGIGLDGCDGQKRVTRTEEMLLAGGSEETHERMQETAIRFSEALQSRGKKLAEVPRDEVVDLLRESLRRSS